MLSLDAKSGRDCVSTRRIAESENEVNSSNYHLLEISKMKICCSFVAVAAALLLGSTVSANPIVIDDVSQTFTAALANGSGVTIGDKKLVVNAITGLSVAQQNAATITLGNFSNADYFVSLGNLGTLPNVWSIDYTISVLPAFPPKTIDLVTLSHLGNPNRAMTATFTPGVVLSANGSSHAYAIGVTPINVVVASTFRGFSTIQIDYHQIPEPSSLLLAGFGVLGMGCVTWVRRRRIRN